MKKLLVYAGITIGVLLVIVLAVGASLPQSHVSSGEAQLPAPPDQVFPVLTDVERYTEWRSGLDRVEVLGRSPLRWREHAGGDAITYEVVEQQPPATLQVRIADPDLPFGGTWTYDLSPAGGGTRVLIVERGEVYNPVFRFISRVVIGHDASIREVLEGLQRRFPSP